MFSPHWGPQSKLKTKSGSGFTHDKQWITSLTLCTTFLFIQPQGVTGFFWFQCTQLLRQLSPRMLACLCRAAPQFLCFSLHHCRVLPFWGHALSLLNFIRCLPSIPASCPGFCDCIKNTVASRARAEIILLYSSLVRLQLSTIVLCQFLGHSLQKGFWDSRTWPEKGNKMSEASASV